MNRIAVAILAVTATATLAVSCASGDLSNEVSGLRDDVKFVGGSYKTKTRPTYKTECKLKTRNKMVNGKNQVETYNDCNKVKNGTETYQDFDPTKWCVELDNLNGDTADDDRWFTVSQGAYDAASEAAEGSQIKFEYVRQGC